MLEGMQTFDQELEKLIQAGTIDRELGLSFATNRTNLQLRLETQGNAASKTESIPFKPLETDSRRTGSFRALDPAARPGRGGNPPSRDGDPDMEDLIER